MLLSSLEQGDKSNLCAILPRLFVFVRIRISQSVIVYPVDISKVKGSNQPGLGLSILNQYKKLRNNVTSQLRKENIELNNNRVSEANDDNEIWRIVKEVTNPQKSSAWSIKIGDTNTMDEKVISETFNEYFR